jgi:hypothetical protein
MGRNHAHIPALSALLPPRLKHDKQQEQVKEVVQILSKMAALPRKSKAFSAKANAAKARSTAGRRRLLLA